MPDLLKVQAETDPTASRTTKVPMSSPTVKFNARTDKNHTSSVSGGLQVYRRAETDDVPSTKMAIEQVTLHAHTLMGVAYATEEILRVRVLVGFHDYPGLFLYHCHMLEHEDSGLMRNYLVKA